MSADAVNIDALFEMMLEQKASDLHLLEGEPPKIRRNGSIEVIPGQELLTADRLRRMLEQICPADRWEVFRKTHDLDFAYAFGDRARFRANYYNQVTGLGAVFRVIPKDIRSLDDLGAPPVLKQFASARKGLVLVTGPTGSGKSTTLAAVIDHINTNFARKILTIEEPIEFIHKNKKSVIVQREVGIDTPSFAAALYDSARSDFDVILVGEMRDLETISLAISAAEKGTLVFGTLHTNSAAKTVDRIVDTFPSDQQKQIQTMLSESLYGVCSQLLVKTKDGQGRLAVHEILFRTLSVANTIREGQAAKLKSIIQTSAVQGMVLMDDALDKLIQLGKITGQEAYMKAADKERFAKHAATTEHS